MLVIKSYKSLTRAKIQNFKTKPSFLAGPLPAATGGKGCVRVPNRKGLQVRTPSSLAVVEISVYSSSATAPRTFIVCEKTQNSFDASETNPTVLAPCPCPRTQCHESYAQPCSRNKIEFCLGFWGRQGSQSSERVCIGVLVFESQGFGVWGWEPGFGFVSRAVSSGHLLKRVVRITSSPAK